MAGMSAWELFVVADDRTGALETAGMCARGFGPVLVSGRPLDATVGCAGSVRAMVVDIASRHVTPAEAGRRVADLSGVESARVAHKIDSTLRGNWAAELVAHSRARAGRRVLVIPSFPQVGRVCTGGVVLSLGHRLQR